MNNLKVSNWIKSKFKKGSLNIGKFIFRWEILNSSRSFKREFNKHSNYKLHFGPGALWRKPSLDWLAVDIDPERADILLNFNEFSELPLLDNSVSCIYGSHVFEHISIFSAPKVFQECFRVLETGGFFRLIIPDVRASINEYMVGNIDYPLFARRINFAKEKFGEDKFTIFEALKGDFISPSGQPQLLGESALAHQNAWDFESISCELSRAGFDIAKIRKTNFQDTECTDFKFEGTYPSEANEFYRSLYIEVIK